MVDEVIVRGRRRPEINPLIPRGGPSRPSLIVGGTTSTPPGGVTERNPSIDLPQDTQRGFVPPPVPPQILPEIVVKAKPTVSRPPVGFGSAAKINLATLFAVVGGTLIAKILEDRSQAKLDEAMAILMRDRRRAPDSRLRVLAAPPASVITVTAKRQPQLLRFIPQPLPLITPDLDPAVLVPILPRFAPERPAIPDVIVAPVEAPTIPQPQRAPINVPKRFIQPRPGLLPSIRPQRFATPSPLQSPSVRPSISPGTAPQAQPRPSVFPSVSPQTAANPLTAIGTRLVSSLSERPAVQTRTQVAAAQQNCPPPPECKKDEELEKPRDRCFKQLVKQGLFPSLDTSYDWEEIDCLTGRAL